MAILLSDSLVEEISKGISKQIGDFKSGDYEIDVELPNFNAKVWLTITSRRKDLDDFESVGMIGGNFYYHRTAMVNDIEFTDDECNVIDTPDIEFFIAKINGTL